MCISAHAHSHRQASQKQLKAVLTNQSSGTAVETSCQDWRDIFPRDERRLLRSQRRNAGVKWSSKKKAIARERVRVRGKKKRRSNGSNKGAVRAKVRQEEIRGSCRGEQEMKKKKWEWRRTKQVWRFREERLGLVIERWSWEESQLAGWEMTGGKTDSEGNKWEINNVDKTKGEKMKMMSREENDDGSKREQIESRWRQQRKRESELIDAAVL